MDVRLGEGLHDRRDRPFLVRPDPDPERGVQVGAGDLLQAGRGGPGGAVGGGDGRHARTIDGAGLGTPADIPARPARPPQPRCR
ncbi:hypothetical protein GCM10023336_11440 [Streptomyces similanensis]|uniref:Uncharacterized protein n=1 Tax=Streptomyces similanensis TaxID=1274988 RepID=A0ABP9JZT9_9ACTN